MKSESQAGLPCIYLYFKNNVVIFFVCLCTCVHACFHIQMCFVESPCPQNYVKNLLRK